MKIETAKYMQKFGFIKRATYKGKPTKKAEIIFKTLQGFGMSFIIHKTKDYM